MIKILLILIGLSGFVYADFSRSVDIVTDSNTGLQWQDNADAGTVTKTWQGAIDYCEVLSLGEKSDWRLPNINELTSLVDDTYTPTIDFTFQNVVSNQYWSSTTNTNYDNGAWIVYFNYGNQYDGHKGNRNYVRCVRTGQ